MSLPEQKKSKWDIVMRKLKESHRKMLNKSNCFSNELQVVKSNQKSGKEIKTFMIEYLNNLETILKRSSTLSEEIRSEGNKIYKRNDSNVNLMDSIFLYSLSLKCSETNSDLAYAHGNRAAALMRLGFNKVARNDCEEAIKVTKMKLKSTQIPMHNGFFFSSIIQIRLRSTRECVHCQTAASRICVKTSQS